MIYAIACIKNDKDGQYSLLTTESANSEDEALGRVVKRLSKQHTDCSFVSYSVMRVDNLNKALEG